MAAITEDRNARMQNTGRSRSLKVLASTVIFKGAMVAVTAAGWAVPATDTSGEIVVGVADQQVDNSSGANGDLSVRVFLGVAAFDGGITPPTQAEIGRPVHVEFDSTVQTAAASSNNVVAGTLELIEDSQFWVNLFDQA